MNGEPPVVPNDTSAVHAHTVLPAAANGSNGTAVKVKRTAGWISTAVVVIVCAILLEVALSTVALISLSNRVDRNARIAALTSCADNNETRREFLVFVDSTLRRSARAAKALIASPNASPDQKAIAARNLAGLRLVALEAHAITKQVVCVYPPTTTTTVRRPVTPTT